jgi:hypothetical protein
VSSTLTAKFTCGQALSQVVLRLTLTKGWDLTLLLEGGRVPCMAQGLVNLYPACVVYADEGHFTVLVDISTETLNPGQVITLILTELMHNDLTGGSLQNQVIIELLKPNEGQIAAPIIIYRETYNLPDLTVPSAGADASFTQSASSLEAGALTSLNLVFNGGLGKLAELTTSLIEANSVINCGAFKCLSLKGARRIVILTDTTLLAVAQSLSIPSLVKNPKYQITLQEKFKVSLNNRLQF